MTWTCPQWRFCFFKKFTIIEVTGKKGRLVPILLTARMKSAFDCMVGLRKKMGLSQGNAYAFSTQKGRFYLRGWDVLTELSGKYQLENPEAIKSTNLRKHVATMSQIMNLADNELDIVAKVMGYCTRVHREYYRLPDNVVQVAKLCKFLITLESGSIRNYHGKRLDDITMRNTTLEVGWYNTCITVANKHH